MWGNRTLFIAQSSWCSKSWSRFRRFSTKVRAYVMIASEVVFTVRIENIVGTRLSSLSKSETSVGLLLIVTKQEKRELGFSLLEPSCLKLSIKGFTDLKKISQNWEPKSWHSYLLRTEEMVFRHKDLKSLNWFTAVFVCNMEKQQSHHYSVELSEGKKKMGFQIRVDSIKTRPTNSSSN